MNEKNLGYGHSKGNQTALSILLSCCCVSVGISIYMRFSIVSWIGTVLLWVLSKYLAPSWSPCKITITNKRIYGSTNGRQINFPISSITAAEVSGIYNLIIHAGAEKIIFYNLKNARTLANTITYLLTEGEDKTDTTNSSLDDIKRLKELLDSGIITQEEFNAKKKQLLGL